MPFDPAKRWSLRTLSTVALLVLAAVALGVTTALGLSSARLQDSTEAIARDTRSMAIADELGLELLSHDRLSYVLLSGPDPRIERDRRERERNLRRLTLEAREHAASEREQMLIAALDTQIAAYLDARAVPAPAIETNARASLERALATLDALRALNERDVERLHRAALSVDRAATLAAAAATALLLFGIAAAALTLRRGVLRPLSGLRIAIERYRAGERNAPIPTGGPREIAGIASAFEEMRAELARRRGEQLAALAGIAHDLRNPLSPLKQAVALLRLDQQRLEQEQTHSSGQAPRMLAIIDRQIDHLNRMISDLLDATRIEAGHLELSRDDLDVRDSVREAADLHRATSGAHQLHVELPDEPVIVHADALRVQQVVGNLLTNAIKYSPEGGPIEVRVEADPHEARIVVRDRGIGISPEDLRGLFAPFHRRDPARDLAPGAGIGLSVVRRIVEAHDGHVSVESEVGVGSTFVVHLPRVA